MAVKVTTREDFPLNQFTFTEATGWHVDDAGRLHITQVMKGNAATFHSNAWVSVEKLPEVPEAPSRKEMSTP